MSNFPKPQSNLFKRGWQRPLYGLCSMVLLLLFILAACSPQETIVEVTRIVTETIEIEGEAVEVEVTRVVTETVTETIVEAEADPNGELPSATGSEGDAEPLPPPPENGPKVVESRGFAQVVAFNGETAVTLRANQTNTNTNVQANVTAISATLNTTELQNLCQLATKTHKKRCP
ncbi:MAG: hypothetical protein GY805_09255 [Chloroflexi bacterium]|nr:hypothetical protein [Chloroflexota bacterium]